MVGTRKVTITKVSRKEKVEMPAGKHCNVMVVASGAKSGLDSGNPSKVREKPTIKEEGKCGWRVGGNFILSCDRGENTEWSRWSES